MPNRVSTFLMFDDTAEEAMNLYIDLFQGSIANVERWGPGEPGQEGSFKRGSCVLAGHHLFCFNSPIKHDFTFTPAVSLFVECASEAELEAAFARLSEGGQVLMPLADYGFSRRFGWVNDRFGVSWQLNLA